MKLCLDRLSAVCLTWQSRSECLLGRPVESGSSAVFSVFTTEELEKLQFSWPSD